MALFNLSLALLMYFRESEMVRKRGFAWLPLWTDPLGSCGDRERRREREEKGKKIEEKEF
jgi:hypothetical protein